MRDMSGVEATREEGVVYPLNVGTGIQDCGLDASQGDLREVIGDDESVVRSVHEEESEEDVLKDSHEDVLDTTEDEDRVEEG
jgi:hypothetical protein